MVGGLFYWPNVCVDGAVHSSPCCESQVRYSTLHKRLPPYPYQILSKVLARFFTFFVHPSLQGFSAKLSICFYFFLSLFFIKFFAINHF
jgi:hypothetical protein